VGSFARQAQRVIAHLKGAALAIVLSMQRLAQLLKRKREAILAEWRRAVTHDDEIPQANQLPSQALRDHIPNILDAIISALERGVPATGERHGRAVAEAQMPRQHAQERFVEGYTLSALLRELSHLRAAIIDAYWSEHDFDPRGVRFLHAALDECAAIAAVQLERAARRDLEEAVDVRERFVAILSHDLRNPLNTVKMTNAILLGTAGFDGRQRQFVERSVRAADRMTQMIDELLDFSRVRAGTIALDKAPVDMRFICEEIIGELHVARPERRIAFECIGEVGGSWDRGRVAQILSNLTSNALAYSPADSIVRVVAEARATT
jgi:signal transduction histidine kinase